MAQPEAEPDPGPLDTSEEADQPGSTPTARAWTITAVLAVAVLLGLAIYSDLDRLLAALAGFDLAYLPAIVGLTLVAYAFRFAKWELYLRVLDIRLGLKMSSTIFFSGLMMSLTPGKVGELWKAWLTQRVGGGSVARTVPAIAAERVTDLVALTGLAALGLGLYQASRPVVAIVAVLFAVFVAAIRWRSLWLPILDRVEDWPVVGGFAEQIATIYEGSFELFALRPLTIALLLSVVAWGLEGIALWAALAGLGVQTGWLLPVFAFGLGSALGALSFLPGGLGAAEASMVGALVASGVARAEAVGATLIVRAGTLWFGAVLGAIVFATQRYRFHRSVQDHSEAA